MQYNKNAILLDKNGRNSCMVNSRHINVRYFFLKKRIDKGEVRIKYFPTHLMLADYFFKSNQGVDVHGVMRCLDEVKINT